MLLISFLFFSPASRYSQKSEAKERTGFVVCMCPLARTAGKARPLLPHNYRTSCSRALFSLSPCFFSSRAFSALCVASFLSLLKLRGGGGETLGWHFFFFSAEGRRVVTKAEPPTLHHDARGPR